ncbi:MAG: response regulator transcription factor [Nitrospinae bacterium]|nr:response regulator transcription factor [Nitrospinota bacterium]MBL7019433.1 response regulator transcription factor [Nitrospinaceae bacterium]
MISSPEKTIKIVIADDHAVVRKGLIQIIDETPGMELIYQAGNGNEVLAKLPDLDVDVLLLDINMPGQTGWEVMQKVHNLYHDIKVVILSVSSEENYAKQFYKAGAAGYLTKDSAPEQLVEAIRKVAGDGIYVSQKFAEKMVSSLKSDSDRALHENLSPRELQIFCMIGAGKTLTEIASELALGVGTVGTYRSRILAKTTLKNNSQITNYAFKNNLVQ